MEKAPQAAKILQIPIKTQRTLRWHTRMSACVCVSEGWSCTFHTGSLSCTIQQGHISDQLLYISLEPQQRAGQLR